jgi:hypothetical protein
MSLMSQRAVHSTGAQEVKLTGASRLIAVYQSPGTQGGMEMSTHDRDRRRARSTYRPAGSIQHAAAKRLMLLSYFSDEHSSASPQELGRALDLSTAAVEELAADLVRAGCLEQDETSGSYQLDRVGRSNDHGKR